MFRVQIDPTGPHQLAQGLVHPQQLLCAQPVHCRGGQHRIEHAMALYRRFPARVPQIVPHPVETFIAVDRKRAAQSPRAAGPRPPPPLLPRETAAAPAAEMAPVPQAKSSTNRGSGPTTSATTSSITRNRSSRRGIKCCCWSSHRWYQPAQSTAVDCIILPPFLAFLALASI